MWLFKKTATQSWMQCQSLLQVLIVSLGLFKFFKYESFIKTENQLSGCFIGISLGESRVGKVILAEQMFGTTFASLALTGGHEIE